MLHKNTNSTIATLLLLTGCASTPSQIIDTANAAKIRVFHGTSVNMHLGTTCYSSKNAEVIHAASGGFSMLVENKKVGIPVTQDIPWSYHEYVIPAGKPITLEMYWATDRVSCGPVGATFTPQVGKYYDTTMLFVSDHCSIQLRELTETLPGKASSKVMSTIPAFACPKS